MIAISFGRGSHPKRNWSLPAVCVTPVPKEQFVVTRDWPPLPTGLHQKKPLVSNELSVDPHLGRLHCFPSRKKEWFLG